MWTPGPGPFGPGGSEVVGEENLEVAKHSIGSAQHRSWAQRKQKSVYSWVSRFLHKIMTKCVFHRVVRNFGSFHGSTRGQNGLLGSVRWFYSRLRRQFLWFWRQCSFDPPDRSTNSKIIQVVATQISFYFHPYLGKIPNLINIFQRGWNHQLVLTTTRIRNQLDQQAPGGTVAYPTMAAGALMTMPVPGPWWRHW